MIGGRGVGGQGGEGGGIKKYRLVVPKSSRGRKVEHKEHSDTVMTTRRVRGLLDQSGDLIFNYMNL